MISKTNINDSLEFLYVLNIVKNLLPSQDINDLDEIMSSIMELRATEDDLRRAREYILKAEPIAAANADEEEQHYLRLLNEAHKLSEDMESLSNTAQREKMQKLDAMNGLYQKEK